VELDILFRDVASVLVDKTVNPETSRPYTLTMLERALKDLHFNPDPKKSAKQQALEVRAQRLCRTYFLVNGSALPATL
jgi:ribosome maturation protein SDO1